MPLTHIEKLVAKAVKDYSLIAEGDRILLGASGGKDSNTLAWALARRQRWQAPVFQLEAVRIATDIPGSELDDGAAGELASLFAAWGVPYQVLQVPVIGRLKKGEKMNCYWCATQRRTELIHYALENGFNKIALGHHLDDILVTLLMNMTRKGCLATMIPALQYDKYPLQIIRPLALVEEDSIRGFSLSQQWVTNSCTCAYGADRDRAEYQQRLEVLCNHSESEKRNLYRSLSQIKTDYLPISY